jgi:hypothetical protein
MLYADDSVLMEELPCELHSQPDIFYEYCQYWKLTVDIEKTSWDSATIYNTWFNIFIYMQDSLIHFTINIIQQ